MDFSLTEEQQLLVDTFRRFADKELKPVADEYRDRLIPRELALRLQSEMLPFGVGAGVVAEELGGLGLDTFTVGLLQFELARVSPDIAVTALIQMIVGKLLPYVPDHLRDDYAKAVLSAEKLGCVGMSEPGAGSQVTAVAIRRRPSLPISTITRPRSC